MEGVWLMRKPVLWIGTWCIWKALVGFQVLSCKGPFCRMWIRANYFSAGTVGISLFPAQHWMASVAHVVLPHFEYNCEGVFLSHKACHWITKTDGCNICMELESQLPDHDPFTFRFIECLQLISASIFGST